MATLFHPAEESVERATFAFLGETGAVIANRGSHSIPNIRDIDDDLRSREAQRVIEHVAQRNCERVLVARHDRAVRRSRDANPATVGRGRELADNHSYEMADMHIAVPNRHTGARIEPRESKDRIDHANGTVRRADQFVQGSICVRAIL